MITRTFRTSLVALGAASIGLLAGRASSTRRAAVELWDTAERVAPVTAVAASARAKADQVAAKRRDSSASARGEVDLAVGLDLARLRTVSEHLEPLVQYLTYIQSRRGQDSSLLFVRYDDIDAMAELDGEPGPELLERLDQLGVVISAN
ncbi:MAG: hypothetical protein ACI867_001229 [Glaciecola sp.]|jgi:hypothetical protein